LSMAISGNDHVKEFSGEYLADEYDVDWYKNSRLGRFNIDGAVGASFSYSYFKLFVGYRWGFLDLETGLSDVTLTTRGLFLGLGYAL